MAQETKLSKKLPETLEAEIKVFADGLPYWSKYMAEKWLSGSVISEEVTTAAYFFLLEELGLKTKSERQTLVIKYDVQKSGNHKSDLLFAKVQNVEGVNALMEGQTIEFGNHLTIIYGANGSGKSGYTRLFKLVFYSKSKEEILKNIHIDTGHKAVSANFSFTSGTDSISLTLNDKGKAEFTQFSVFDGKSVIRHLDQRNEFEFRPSGLAFFADYTAALAMVEQKLNADLSLKKTGSTAQDLADLFDGESEIKSFVQALSSKSKAADLQKFAPFTEIDKAEKVKIDKTYDELLLASKDKEKQISQLLTIKKLLAENKLAVEKLNQHFGIDYLKKIRNAIQDCLDKESITKAEGVESFKTETILGVGSEQWKNFIIAAETFARMQDPEQHTYPKKGDSCLLCQQPLSPDAINLIANYWSFIKSVAEENFNKSQEILNKLETGLGKFVFDLFPENNTLTDWLTERYPEALQSLKDALAQQKTLCETIISDVKAKKIVDHTEVLTSLEHYKTIGNYIDTVIASLRENEQSKELAQLNAKKTYLAHKEKFNTHLAKFETFLENQDWIAKAGKANFRKAKTDTTYAEKALSDKYFSQKYIDAFNDECKKMNGNFGIEISHTGSAGKSYRQLKLKGNNPNAVLSEGEQKVIAIADFIAEMRLSEINRGIIFDDPVTSLDETRKSEIAKRLVEESLNKQTIIFTHDLVFVSSLIGHCADIKATHVCHWIENRSGNPGQIWLNNAPSYEKEYRSAEPAKKYYNEAKKDDCPPAQREFLLKTGFASLRTSYEVLVINDLFKNVVQRFNERVSIEALNSVFFDSGLIDELQDSFGQCCRYMEGHTHSDKYAYKKPEPNHLNEEIQRFEAIRAKVKKFKKPATEQ
ncbi:AAA family ATPase [Chitinophaga pollutisoli]|uniref:AAA family ATPase n=1 Tax=Chitinophaga pollutisoli TaxID=3133966 RepID=A0ABZ2YRC1_9BACT